MLHSTADSLLTATITAPRWFRRHRRKIFLAGATLLLGAIWSTPPLLPAVLEFCRDDVTMRVPDARKRIFLTIDDGPSAATSAILGVLAKHGVTATFFITGGHVHDAGQLDAIRAAGHALGHHMKTTQACSTLTIEEFRADFDEVDKLLAAAGGAQWFRPPSDFGTREQIAHAASRGYRAVAGTVFPLDHWLESPGAIRRLAAWLAIDGGIVILHDGAARGPRTAAVLDELIPQLRQRGYTFGALATAFPAAAARR